MNGNKNNVIVPKNEFYTRENCRICDSRELFKFLSLRYTPLANSLLKKDDLEKPEKYYPLEVCLCRECYLVQLSQVVYPEFLFKHYVYTTSSSIPMQKHFYNFAVRVIRDFKLDKNSLVVDVGSNDGTLLSKFLNLGFRVLGIEPASNIAEIAERKGIKTINKFFCEKAAFDITREFKKAKVILATNVFAHVDNLNDFMKGIDHLLDNDGVFIIEVPYILNLLKNIEFDTIYHEHLSYFAVYPLAFLFKKFNMYIADVSTIGVHGGSLRIFVRKGKGLSSKNVYSLLAQEEEFGIKDISVYTNFARRVNRIKDKILRLLNELKNKSQKICGYGATAKSTTLLNYCGIKCNLIDFIVDTTPLKQGLFSPGVHIPIYSMDKFYQDFSDYALLLAWNYARDILQREKGFLEKGGKFILPIPEPKII